MTPTELIAEARALDRLATPGPWKYNETETSIDKQDGTAVLFAMTDGQDFPMVSVHDNDAAFIARSRTLIPALCDALEAAQARENPKVLDYRDLGGKRGQPAWMQIPDDRLWQSRWVLIGTAIQSPDGTDIGVFLGGFGNEAAFYYKDYGEKWILYPYPPRRGLEGGENG